MPNAAKQKKARDLNDVPYRNCSIANWRMASFWGHASFAKATHRACMILRPGVSLTCLLHKKRKGQHQGAMVSSGVGAPLWVKEVVKRLELR